MAPEKRGKTWLMIDIAIRALRQKANVAFSGRRPDTAADAAPGLHLSVASQRRP